MDHDSVVIAYTDTIQVQWVQYLICQCWRGAWQWNDLMH